MSGLLLVACVVVSVLPGSAVAEQASQPGSTEAAALDAGAYHTCAFALGPSIRCWGFNGDGQLGYGNTKTIGDDETPASVGGLNVGSGRTATAISAGDYHTCALLDDGSVRCWGFGADGRLGYGNIANVESPASVGAVDLGAGRTAKAITAGGAHTCAVLDNGDVRCWGYGASGQLGYANTASIGDTEAPSAAGPVNLGLGRTAVAISAGARHTCALLDEGSVRCWGDNSVGELGYGNTDNVGDTQTPDMAGPVRLGLRRTATAISAGGNHTCAVLDDRSVRCWGYGGNGQLGYASPNNVGNDRTPDLVGAVDLGPGRTALTISAGGADTCAVLDDRSVRCWGYGRDGQLGYANTDNIGDDETPGSVGTVNLGLGRTALAVGAGQSHTCARLDDHSVRCWGYGGQGRLGYCSQESIGDDEPVGSAGPVHLEDADQGIGCKSPPRTGSPTVVVSGVKTPTASSDEVRAHGLRTCLARVAAHARREKALTRRGSARRRARAKHHRSTHATAGHRRCLRLYGRTPGRITGLRARAVSKHEIELSFNAPGTNGNHPPAARNYLVKQSLHSIRTARGFSRARALCSGSCRYTGTQLGGTISLTVTDLRPHTSYYYAVAARDNVSARHGPRSRQIKQRTR
ncbi:MAG: hypothetical protein M3Z33_08405 [Actinomycetota bacterium]|nr:hypothetical protein [Actinomycetota bacterium]